MYKMLNFPNFACMFRHFAAFLSYRFCGDSRKPAPFSAARCAAAKKKKEKTYSVTREQVETEICQIAELLKNHGLDGTGMMIWWDVEDRETLQPLGRTKLTELIRTAQAKIEAAGGKVELPC